MNGSTQVWATDRSIIDLIDPRTGLTEVFGHTAEQVIERDPDAFRTTFEEYQRAAAKRQDTPIQWREITEESYIRALNVLPPIDWNGRAFLLGEPQDHHALSGFPRFTGYIRRYFRFYESARPLTVQEFRSVVSGEVRLEMMEGGEL